MSEQRNFTLIGNFTDNITSKLTAIQTTINRLNSSFSRPTSRGGGVSRLTSGLRKVSKELGTLSSAHRTYRESVRESAATERDFANALSRSVQVMGVYRRDLGRISGAHIRMRSSSQTMSRSLVDAWGAANSAVLAYIRNQNRVRARFPTPPRGGGYGGRYGGGGYGGGAPSPSPQGSGAPRGRSGRAMSFIGDFVFANLAMWLGRTLLMSFQRALNSIFRAFAERTRDQLEDIASAGGIFSAARFGGAKGLPVTFQGALELQDEINKQMASVAAALPGTTQDYVMNARRMTDTLAQVMTKDLNEFEKLAQKLSGDTRAKGEKAFTIVNVEIAKATTLLEKLNPTRTIVPMTQIVEDMMKSERVSVGGLRRYVSFRRATTFEAALNRNLKELNAAGAGTSKRLGAIIKVLKEAVPPELLTAMTTSVSGVIEAFRSAILDPDQGIFGLSRTLGLKVRKFNKETGELMKDEFGRAIMDTTNLFKIFAETFGNLGNLINSAILPGIASIYSPFEGIADALVNLRDYSFHIFQKQQSFTAWYSKFAERYGMAMDAFKAQEKGGVAVLVNLLKTYQMISPARAEEIFDLMEKKGPAEDIAKSMKGIYQDIIPKIFDSPFFQKISEVLGFVLGKFMVAIADLLKVITGANKPNVSAFTDAFDKAGGFKALDYIVVTLIEGITKILLQVLLLMLSALWKAISGFNFLAVLGMVVPPLLIASILPGSRSLIRAIVTSIFRGLLVGFSRGGRGIPAPIPNPASIGRQTVSSLGYGLVGGGGARGAATSGRRGLFGSLGNLLSGAAGGKLQSGVTGGTPGALGKLTSALNKIPKAGAIGAVASLGLSMASGQSFGKAAAGTFGAVAGGAAVGALGAKLGKVVGGALGSALGPIGTLAGSLLGSVAGGFIYDALVPPSKEQVLASQKQREASYLQLQAAKIREAGIDTSKYGAMQLGSVEEFRKRISYIGLEGAAASALVSKYQAQASSVQSAAAAGRRLNEEIALVRRLYGEGSISKAVMEERTRALQVKYNEAKAKAEATIREFSLSFEGIGPQIRKKIIDSIKIEPIGSLEGNRGASQWAKVIGGDSKQVELTQRTLSGKDPFWQSIIGGLLYISKAVSGVGYSGHLGTAIASEIRHKPPGSDLIIANSSETVIPAAGGYGMESFIRQLSITSRNTAASANLLVAIRKSINDMHFDVKTIRDINKEALSLSELVNVGQSTTPSFQPSPNYVPGTISEGQIIQPNRNLTIVPIKISKAASKDYELAYAGMPAAPFTSGGSVTWNKFEAPITIYQQPGQDSEELAAMVAARIGMAIDEARNVG